MKTLRYGSARLARYLARRCRARARRGRAVRARGARAIVARGAARRRRGARAVHGALRRRAPRPATDPRAGRGDPRRSRGGPTRRVVAALARDGARASRPSTGASCDRGFRVRLADGSVLEEAVRPLDSVGPLRARAAPAPIPSSVLMNAIPARVAGVPRLVVATPPRTLEANPAVAAALVVVGLEGARLPRGRRPGRSPRSPTARATVPAVEQDRRARATPTWPRPSAQVRGLVEIDHEAGPSEVVILADDDRRRGLRGRRPPGPGRARQRRRDGRAGHAVAELWPPRWRASWTQGRASVAQPRGRARARSRRNGADRARARPRRRASRAVNALAPEHAEVMTRGAGAVGRAHRGRRRLRRAAARRWRWATTASGPTTCCPPAARRASPRRSRCATSSGAAAVVRAQPRAASPASPRDVVRVAHGRRLPGPRAERADAVRGLR